MVDIATLAFNIDSSQAKTAQRDLSGLERSGAQAERGVNRASDALNRMSRIVGPLVASLAGLLTIRSVSRAMSDAALQIDEAAKAARRLDGSVAGFQAMSLVAQEAGVSVGALTNAVQTMDREIARGSDASVRAFNRLGLAASSLAGLDVDERMAVLADAVQAAGLSAGEATAALADLGIRTREVVLAIMDGGDAFRDARSDIEDYGLAISEIDARRIEEANDAIGRLSIVSQLFGQTLALQLRPALGDLATSITDSMREGGALRVVIEGLANAIGFLIGGPIQLLADNLQLIASTAAAGAVVLLTRYIPALVTATSSTLAWAASLVTLRGALMATGIGALVVGAGLALNALINLTRATGSLGDALRLLLQVARGVWEGIVTAAGAIPAGLNAIWERMKSGFLGAISDMLVSWSNFLRSVAETGQQIPLIGDAFNAVSRAADNAANSARNYGVAATQAGNASAAFRRESQSLVSQGINTANAAMDRLRAAVRQTTQDFENGAISAEEFAAKMREVEDAVGSGRSGGAGGVVPAIEELNENLEQTPQIVNDVANAWADFVVRGFRDFQGFVRSVIGSFRNMLRDMIAMAARNRIMISLGVTGGGVAGAPAMAGGLPGIGGGGGLLGGLLGTFGSAAAGTVGTGFLGGFGNAFGIGLSGFNPLAIGANAAMAGGGLAATLGAIAAPLAIVGGLFAFFRSTTRTIDQGLRLTIRDMDALVETFERTETRRFFGLSRSRSTSFSEADPEFADPIVRAVAETQKSIMGMAEALGVAGDVFEDFRFRVRFSTEGMSEEQIAQRFEREIQNFADEFAERVFTTGVQTVTRTVDRGFKLVSEAGQDGRSDRLVRDIEEITETIRELDTSLVRPGESAAQALQDLFISITAVNNALLFLDRTMLEMSLTGAAAARNIVELMGGLENFQQAHQVYFENFFSLQEQFDLRTAALTRQFDELNIAVPETREAYRALVEAQDLTTEAGRENYAALLLLAGEFAALDELSTQLGQSMGEVAASITDVMREIEALTARRDDLAARLAGPEAERELQLSRLLSDEARELQLEIFDLTDAIAAQAQATRDAESAASAAEAIARQREQLEVRILRAQGDTAALRERELEALDPSNRELLRLVFSLEDAADAANEAARAAEELARAQEAVARERFGLETRLLQLQGNTAALRRRELEALDSSNRALQLRIFALEDEKRIADERFGLETRALELQQRSVELRERELDALDPANRGLQRFVWQLEDAARALQDLSEEDFASRVEFERARARATNILMQEIPGFASGGFHRGGLRVVGESGPELEMTGPSRIFSAAQTRELLRPNDNNDLGKELKEMKEYVRELVKINIKQERELKEIRFQGEDAA